MNLKAFKPRSLEAWKATNLFSYPFRRTMLRIDGTSARVGLRYWFHQED
jgi:hypothetical protein